MSRREVRDCDRCGRREIDPVTVDLTTGYSPDPAGGRSEPDTTSLDLCGTCAAWAFEKVAVKLEYEEASKLINEVKAYHRAYGKTSAATKGTSPWPQ